MKSNRSFCYRFGFTIAALIWLVSRVDAVDRTKPPVNVFGAPIRDAQGCQITYTREEMAAMARSGTPALPGEGSRSLESQLGSQKGRKENEEFVPTSNVTQPFWQYA